MQQGPQVNPSQLEAIARGMAENGRVLATLDDWRAIMFGIAGLFIVVLAILVAIIMALFRANRQERQEMSARLDRALLVSDKFGEAAKLLHADYQVQQSQSARIEGALGKCEDLLSSIDRARRGPAS
jgi:hypothetical protein